MASIILSFVGQQDPFAKKDTEGSIVTLTRHLTHGQTEISRVLLMYTDSMKQNAIDTQQWLLTELKDLAESQIEIIPVDEALSQDPIDQVLAIKAARKVVERAQQLQAEDYLECNASSGTPAMKSVWGVLQAAGYLERSHIWQVRDPGKTQAGQERVFRNDVNYLKDQQDQQIIQQQVRDYNYSSALITLENSNLRSPIAEALINYGYYRISFDFNRASNSLLKVKEQIDPIWNREISGLRSKQTKALLCETYFNGQTRLKGKKYADFLVNLSRLHENILKYLVRSRLDLLLIGRESQDSDWQKIKQFEGGMLYGHLRKYKLPSGYSLRVDEYIGRWMLIGILEYFPAFAQKVPLLKELNEYCDMRNDVVHELVGISELKEEKTISSKLASIMKQVTELPDENPFDRLNHQICQLLDQSL